MSSDKHVTPLQAVRELQDETLGELAALCQVDPAEPAKCVSCAAYMESYRRTKEAMNRMKKRAKEAAK